MRLELCPSGQSDGEAPFRVDRAAFERPIVKNYSVVFFRPPLAAARVDNQMDHGTDRVAQACALYDRLKALFASTCSTVSP